MCSVEPPSGDFGVRKVGLFPKSNVRATLGFQCSPYVACPVKLARNPAQTPGNPAQLSLLNREWFSCPSINSCQNGTESVFAHCAATYHLEHPCHRWYVPANVYTNRTC